MEIKKLDYVVGNDGKKNFLMLVNHVADGIVSGVLDVGRAYTPKNAEFKIKQVIAVLGPKPAVGSSYGCIIEPYVSTSVHPDWGNVHWHKYMPVAEKKQIKLALDNTAKRLNTAKLFGFVEQGALELEVKPAKGKYTGMYHFYQKGDKASDRMVLRPQDGTPLDYVILHEAGHGVWYRLLSPKVHARWVKLYHNYTKVQDFDLTDINRLRDQYLEDSIHIRDFRGQLPEDDVLLFDSLISTLSGNTRLTAKHLDLLADQQELESVKDVWPQHVEDSDFEIAITEYATKNVEELFAEAFAFKMLGQKLPKRIDAVMEKTLEHARQAL